MAKTLEDDFPAMPSGIGWATQPTVNHFATLAAIDVSAQIEKKNNLSYLSWAWAVDRLMRADPTASWAYHEPLSFGNTLMVSCTVTAFGKPMTMQLPVMDYKNKAIANPDAFAVNTAMQRCLVKAIALHGLGLYIYAGEDLPYEEGKGAPVQKEVSKSEPKKYAASGSGIKEEAYDTLDTEGQAWVDSVAYEVTTMFNEGTPVDGLIAHLREALGPTPDQQFKLAIWHKLDSKVRTFIDRQEKGIRAAA